jgi:hypothetical protein
MLPTLTSNTPVIQLYADLQHTCDVTFDIVALCSFIKVVKRFDKKWWSFNLVIKKFDKKLWSFNLVIKRFDKKWWSFNLVIKKFDKKLWSFNLVIKRFDKKWWSFYLVIKKFDKKLLSFCLVIKRFDKKLSSSFLHSFITSGWGVFSLPLRCQCSLRILALLCPAMLNIAYSALLQRIFSESSSRSSFFFESTYQFITQSGDLY